jgi:hypothetical protein
MTRRHKFNLSVTILALFLMAACATGGMSGQSERMSNPERHVFKATVTH